MKLGMFIEGVYYKNKLFLGVTDGTLYNIDAIHPYEQLTEKAKNIIKIKNL